MGPAYPPGLQADPRPPGRGVELSSSMAALPTPRARSFSGGGRPGHVEGIQGPLGDHTLETSSTPTPSTCVCSVAQSCLTLATPQTVAHQAPLFMGLSRQEYWSGLPCPLRDPSHPWTELVSLRPPALAGESFTTSATYEAHILHTRSQEHSPLPQPSCSLERNRGRGDF